MSNATLVRFYTLHFLLPFVVLARVLLHIFYLHTHGRSNPLGTPSNQNKVPFHYYFRVKDRVIYFMFLYIFIVVTLQFGYNLMDAENWIPANPLVTPTHIQPEWYFLFAYAILRSIPNKLGGVLGLLLAVLSPFLFRIGSRQNLFRGFRRTPLTRLAFWRLVVVFLLLTWLGRCPAASPYNEVGLLCTVAYFVLVGGIAASTHIRQASYNTL